MTKVLDDFDVDNVEMNLRRIQAELESVRESICDVVGGYMSWNEINQSVEHIRKSLELTWRMRSN